MPTPPMLLESAVLPQSQPDSGGDLLDQRSEAAQLRARCECLSLVLMSAGHELRQGLHQLLGTLNSIARKAHPSDNGSRIQAVKTLTCQLIEEFQTLALLGSASRPDFRSSMRCRVELHPLLSAVCSQWQTEAHRKGIELHVESSDSVVLTNASWLAVILRNIVGNAIRYTPVGRVRIGIERSGADWVLSVCDNGPGIGEEVLRRSLDSPQPRIRDGGLGLGLSIVRQTARLLGHGLSISSLPLYGTTVRLRLAATEASPPTSWVSADKYHDAT